MTRAYAVDAFDLAGSRYEVGYRHGRQLREKIRAFVADGLCRINSILYRPTTLAELAPTIDGYREAIEAQLPEFAEEIRGLADGAGISYEEAVLLQIRREVLGYQKIPARGDCTTFARRDDTGPVLAQTVDLNGNLESELYVLRVSLGDGTRVLLLTFTGLLGYLGVNTHGLAVGLNLVMGGDWHPGIPAYMAIRHLLETATCARDAVDRLGRLRLASSRALTLCDRDNAINVEILNNELRCTEAPALEHTNHYLADDFRAADEINVFAKNGSRRRLDACRAALAGVPGAGGAEDYFGVLARHPICVHADGDIRREATVGAVVMRPARGEMYVRQGYPCRAQTQRFLC